MGRQRWRGLWDRGAPAAAAPGDAARAGDDGDGRPDPARPSVPGWLERAAGWAWRLLILGALRYVLFRLIGTLRVVVLPCVAALLPTPLLQPLTQRLRRARPPPPAAPPGPPRALLRPPARRAAS